MNSDEIKTFTYRISQANRTELTVICYDIILKDIDGAIGAEAKASAAEAVKHSLKFVNELMGTLDFKYELSHRLRQLYIYVHKELLAAQFELQRMEGKPHGYESKTVTDDIGEKLKNARSVIDGLRSAFHEAAKSDDSKPLMQNVQQVYAGLTYGRNSLVETELGADTGSRGFLA